MAFTAGWTGRRRTKECFCLQFPKLRWTLEGWHGSSPQLRLFQWTQEHKASWGYGTCYCHLWRMSWYEGPSRHFFLSICFFLDSRRLLLLSRLSLFGHVFPMKIYSKTVKYISCFHSHSSYLFFCQHESHHYFHIFLFFYLLPSPYLKCLLKTQLQILLSFEWMSCRLTS